VRDGGGVGGRAHDGMTHPADVVVSNADPAFTYGTLLAEVPRAAPMRARLRRARPSMSLHVLYLGADRTWPDAPLLHHNLLFPREQDRELRRIFAGRAPRPAGATGGSALPRDPFLYVHVPSRTDPTMAPPGSTALYVLLATPARRQPVADPGAEAQQVRELVLDVLEARGLTGIRAHLVAERAIGPEHFREQLNTAHGAAFSLQPTLLQSGWFRPHNRSGAVPNLYLVGAGTHPGAGVPAVLASGKIAAHLVTGRSPAGAVPAP
jgi:phytoene desaturase